jgi:hypothetical protein
MSLRLPGQGHDFPTYTLKWLPKFAGNNVVTIEDHIDQLVGVFEILGVEHDDVALYFFTISLEGPTKAWFQSRIDN